MTERNTLFRRLAAGVGAVALATVGLLGATNAYAEDGATTPAPAAVEQIDPNAKGSIIVHKHVKDETSTPGNPKGDPLKGVTFKVQEVKYGVPAASIDLTTAAGWALAEALYAPTAPPPPTLPAGYSLATGTSDKTGENGQVTFSNLSVGVYLVTETDSGPNLITGKAAPFFVTIPMPHKDNGSWIYDVHAYPKNVLGTVTPTKTPNDPNHKVWGVGTTVAWDIKVPVPAADQDFTSFVITDTVMTGLQFDSWGAIKIGTTTLTAGTAGPPQTGDYYVADSVLTFTDAGLAKLNAGRAAAQEVTAVVNTTVLESPDGKLVNTVEAKINGTPGNAEGSTNWGDLVLTKKSKGTETKLTGAVFDVYEAKEGNKIGTLTDNADGTYTANIFVGNDNVTSRVVWLKEVTAPSGHVLPADPWFGPYTIEADSETTTEVEIENHKPTGPTLPQTGSTGSLMLVLVGLGLVGASGALFAARRFRTSH